jgi:hypothetical protein
MLSYSLQTDLVLVAPQNFILSGIDDSWWRISEDDRQEIAEWNAFGSGGNGGDSPCADA